MAASKALKSCTSAWPQISAWHLPPPFLLPSLYTTQQTRTLHATPVPHAQPKRETSKLRGMSAMRRSGLRKDQNLSVKLENLPRPREREEPETPADHGLWRFFNIDRTAVAPPEEMAKHGRAWTVEELRRKSFEDLHKLWWKCVYERNRIATEEAERERIKAGYGESEATDRDDQVKLTMRAIKHTLTERYYTWENARKAAKADPTIRLDRKKARAYVSDERLEAEQYQQDLSGEDLFEEVREPARAKPSNS